MPSQHRNGPESFPVWEAKWLIAAGIYNLVWGGIVVVWPHWLFDFAGAERLNHPEIWQCLGMVVGVYGVGYLIAANDPRTHWPIVLVGLLGKVFGPIGFAFALSRGAFPPLFGLTILTNDLVWWLPFTMILRDAWRHPRTREGFGRTLSSFVRETLIDAPPAEVFRFHESADALTKLIPPWEKMRVIESAGSLSVGSRVILHGHVGPVPIRWVAVHTEYEPPLFFEDRQESGPFAVWVHRHQFLPMGSGATILRDEVEYAPPLGWLGGLVDGWLIRPKIEAMFAYRHEVTKRTIESERQRTERER